MRSSVSRQDAIKFRPERLRRENDMSQPAAKALDLPFDLVYSDGIPLDSHRERIQLNLLIHMIRQAMAARGQEDFFTSGNMFVYYSPEQARDVVEGRPYLRGPDVFFVDHVAP